ncbi:hypothetical protein CcaCcLH18_12803 [Colletotrichum camelliae]|nr:hypothetical protein CcaCcLH18_12803 [Colletotrichum camelliae]
MLGRIHLDSQAKPTIPQVSNLDPKQILGKLVRNKSRPIPPSFVPVFWSRYPSGQSKCVKNAGIPQFHKSLVSDSIVDVLEWGLDGGCNRLSDDDAENLPCQVILGEQCESLRLPTRALEDVGHGQAHVVHIGQCNLAQALAVHFARHRERSGPSDLMILATRVNVLVADFASNKHQRSIAKLSHEVASSVQTALAAWNGASSPQQPRRIVDESGCRPLPFVQVSGADDGAVEPEDKDDRNDLAASINHIWAKILHHGSCTQRPAD